jgi:hypothetical protein
MKLSRAAKLSTTLNKTPNQQLNSNIITDIFYPRLSAVLYLRETREEHRLVLSEFGVLRRIFEPTFKRGEVVGDLRSLYNGDLNNLYR